VKPTKPWTLALLLVLAGAVTWAVLIPAYASLPALTWTGVPALLIAAMAEAWAGWDLRARIAGKRGARTAPPLFVARVVALAKASSQTAALLAGICAGFMVYLAGKASAPTPRADLVVASLSFGSCLVLLAAALFLEYCCRVPGGGEGDEVPPAPPSSPFGH
jgi:Protein of unknown function (DUF3180)